LIGTPTIARAYWTVGLRCSIDGSLETMQTGDTTPKDDALPPSLVALLAIGAGLSAAALYYNQPVLDVIARELRVSPGEIGVVPMLTQLGYATGLFVFAPLADRFDRRRVIVVKAVLLGLALIAAGLAHRLDVLALASFAIGLSATLAQDLVPAAAVLAAPQRRGNAVGRVMTGLLLGILLSRVVSGAVAARGDWRWVFFGAAALEWTLAAVCPSRLPRFAPTTREPYLTLLTSMLTLVKRHAPLRRAALAQGLVSVAFSGFWSTLAIVLAAPPFELGSVWAGAFGVAGAAGAIAAPIAGGLADRRGPDVVIRLGIGIVLASFVAMAIAPGSLALLVIATLTFDLGVSLSLVSHQTIVYGIDPAARSRLNALLVTAMFLGMAAGAAIAARVCDAWGLRGVASFASCAALLALVVRLAPSPGPPEAHVA